MDHSQTRIAGAGIASARGHAPTLGPTVEPPGSNLPIRRLLDGAEERCKELLDVLTNQLEPRLAAISRPHPPAGNGPAKELKSAGVSEHAQTLTRINGELEIAIERLHAYIGALEV